MPKEKHNSSHRLVGDEFLRFRGTQVHRHCSNCNVTVFVRMANEADKRNLKSR